MNLNKLIINRLTVNQPKKNPYYIAAGCDDKWFF